MKAAIRVDSLNTESLGKQENHGKRLDDISQIRKINDNPPLVFGGLNLQDLYFQHIQGCKKNASLKKPIQHAFIQFPIAIKATEKNQEKFLKAAIEFINSRFGGDAVFAARLDRDEAGKHGVDVFFVPKYTKTTKARGDEIWISNSKHGKELCERHRAEIEHRSNGKFNTRPRAVGIALQNELRSFLEKDYGLNLDQKKWKTKKEKDRLNPEDYKIKKLMEEIERLKAKVDSFTKAFVAIRTAIIPFEDLLPKNLKNLINSKYFKDLENPENRETKIRKNDDQQETQSFFRR